jgi:hypothetical protein
MLSGIIMPLFNIPLILRIIRRRSSGDVSMVWLIGVWSCVIAMLPSSLQSPDPVLVVFGIINSLFSRRSFSRFSTFIGMSKIEQSRFVNVDEPLQNLCHSLLMAHECTTLKRANFRFSILNPRDP